MDAVINQKINKLKSTLCAKINQELDSRNYTQAQMAALLGTSQPRIHLIRKERLEQLSLDSLFGYLLELGTRSPQKQVITLKVKPS